MRYAYPCILEPEADGGFSVSFPDVPGALTCGDSRSEALVQAEDALVGALGAHFSLRGQSRCPAPSRRGKSWSPSGRWPRRKWRSTLPCANKA